MIKIEIDDVTVDRRLLFFRFSLSLRVLMFNESDSLFPCIAHPFIHKKKCYVEFPFFFRLLTYLPFHRFVVGAFFFPFLYVMKRLKVG